MKILKFNESNEPHEIITDYFLEWVEVDGFIYEPQGSFVRLFYSGVAKDYTTLISKYLTLIARLEKSYGVKTKTIRIEESQTQAQIIQIEIQLDKVSDFKIGFKIQGQRITADIISCSINGYNQSGDARANLTNIYKIKLNLSNISSGKDRYNYIEFMSNGHRPLGKTYCYRYFGNNSYQFDIDTTNVKKILDAIKSQSIKINDCRLEEVLPFIERLKPEDLSNIK